MPHLVKTMLKVSLMIKVRLSTKCKFILLICSSALMKKVILWNTFCLFGMGASLFIFDWSEWYGLCLVYFLICQYRRWLIKAMNPPMRRFVGEVHEAQKTLIIWTSLWGSFSKNVHRLDKCLENDFQRHVLNSRFLCTLYILPMNHLMDVFMASTNFRRCRQSSGALSSYSSQSS